jgi:phosphatidylglycerol:prolipoprotein diacylglycerol transferase
MSARRSRTRWLARPYGLRIGQRGVSTYLTMLYLGCVLGTLVGAAVARATGLDPERFSLSAVVLLVPAFVGARLWYAAGHRALFHGDPRRLWRRADGGAALYGGLLAAFVCSVPVLAVAGLPLGGFWDAASTTMLTGLILTRVGCQMHGCCAGRPTVGRVGVELPNARGEWRRRYPTQLLEAAWGAVTLAGVLTLRPDRPFPGAVCVVAVGSYAAARLVLDPLRETDPTDGTTGLNRALSWLLVAAAVVVLGSGAAG